MPVEEPLQACAEGLGPAVRRRITQKTWGRVQELRVAVADGRVVVHGLAPSYYVKQLALLAVREAAGDAPVELAIKVTPAAPRQGYDVPISPS
jgi:hypothetical protein